MLGVVAGEVLPVQKHAWEVLLDRTHKLFNESFVVCPFNALMTPAHVKRIVKKYFVVRAYIERDRQRARGVNCAAK